MELEIRTAALPKAEAVAVILVPLPAAADSACNRHPLGRGRAAHVMLVPDHVITFGGLTLYYIQLVSPLGEFLQLASPKRAVTPSQRPALDLVDCHHCPQLSSYSLLLPIFAHFCWSFGSFLLLSFLLFNNFTR